ncbi:MAG: Rrf2 family transcriptional regulator [Pseudomonadota bacterium]
MRLTAYTDYSLRTLMFLALDREQSATIQEIADAHGIAKNHLTKVVHQLGMLGYVTTTRGRNGGLRLAREPAQINIGEVVRQTENDFYMASCFDQLAQQCIYSDACALQGALARATTAFLTVLDGVNLEQMMVREARTLEATTSRRPQTVALHLKRA